MRAPSIQRPESVPTWPRQLYNPYNGNAIPFNNLVTGGLFNPATETTQISALANLFPHANLTPTAANNGTNYQYSSRQAVNPYHWDSRFDFRISSKDSVFVAWSQYAGTPTMPAAWSQPDAGQRQRKRQVPCHHS